MAYSGGRALLNIVIIDDLVDNGRQLCQSALAIVAERREDARVTWIHIPAKPGARVPHGAVYVPADDIATAVQSLKDVVANSGDCIIFLDVQLKPLIPDAAAAIDSELIRTISHIFKTTRTTISVHSTSAQVARVKKAIHGDDNQLSGRIATEDEVSDIDEHDVEAKLYPIVRDRIEQWHKEFAEPIAERLWPSHTSEWFRVGNKEVPHGPGEHNDWPDHLKRYLLKVLKADALPEHWFGDSGCCDPARIHQELMHLVGAYACAGRGSSYNLTLGGLALLVAAAWPDLLASLHFDNGQPRTILPPQERDAARAIIVGLYSAFVDLATSIIKVTLLESELSVVFAPVSKPGKPSLLEKLRTLGVANGAVYEGLRAVLIEGAVDRDGYRQSRVVINLRAAKGPSGQLSLEFVTTATQGAA